MPVNYFPHRLFLKVVDKYVKQKETRRGLCRHTRISVLKLCGKFFTKKTNFLQTFKIFQSASKNSSKYLFLSRRDSRQACRQALKILFKSGQLKKTYEAETRPTTFEQIAVQPKKLIF